MVLLHKQLSSRKRPPSNTFVSPFLTPPKIPKSTTTTAAATTAHRRVQANPASTSSETLNPIDKMVSVLADAGCTLINPSGPPCLPSDPYKLRHHLRRLFSSDSALRSEFLAGFSSYINSPHDLRRVLMYSHRDGSGSMRSESLVRVLLLVPSIQLDLQNMLLEKLPEYFDEDPSVDSAALIDEDVSRLILNQFRWLDFLTDSEVFTDKLLQVLSICPLHLKKEIIGSLPEIIGDQNNKAVVDSLEQMLQEDSAVIVPVLDSFSNLNLDDQLREQVIMIAISCIRTIDVEHMPYLLRFLLLSATPTNAGRIISRIREQLKFIGVSNVRSTQHNKLKGKSVVDNGEASILDALRSSLRFNNILCQEILKELKCLDKARDHKVIDIWLLMLIYMNGESLQKSVEKIFKKKIADGCIQEVMFDRCISGNKELVRDYFPSFLSLSECLLACKEQKARGFGIHIYTSLFEEYVDTYSRQEVLGALVSHVGSGVSFEVGSALETMILLASKYSQELIPLSSHITGILDYLEGFSVENLHKVYEVFSVLALSARSCAESFGSSISNELLMIVRKQLSNPDPKYKKMGLVGTLKIVSCLGDSSSPACSSSSQKSNYEEALELLKTSLDSCKQVALLLILFYDELIALLDCRTLHPAIMEWIGKHIGEFESMFLSDLEGGQLPIKDSYCGLEGELWMNLDGDISPICLNILPLVSSSAQSGSSLQILPANFLLLSVIERLANQGSLGGIDALLGCPLHLPSTKVFSEPTWQSLTGKQKQIVCLSVYYAANWIRELLNAFCTQITGRFECISQATREEIIAKLLKRLRNLVFLESLLNKLLKEHPLALPELYPNFEHHTSSSLNQPSYVGNLEKSEHVKLKESTAPNKKRKNGKSTKASTNSDVNDKLRQPTIVDVLRKAGVITSQERPNDDSSGLSSNGSTSESTGHRASESSEPLNVEVFAAAKVLDTQRYKFRPLLVDCFTILAFSKNQESCCPDPAAELPLHLYLLVDLRCKMDYISSPSKQFSAKCSSTPPGFGRMTVNAFLFSVRPLFPSLRKHLNCATNILKNGAESCKEHLITQSASAGNPDLLNVVVSQSSISRSIFKETLCCFSKMLNLPDIHMEKSVLSDLLEAFQPIKIPDCIFSGMQQIPSPGSMDYLYWGTSCFLEAIMDEAISYSFTLASEVLLTMDSVVTSIKKFLDKSLEGNGKEVHTGFIQELLPALHKRLGTSAQKLLKHNWASDNLENGWKSKGEFVRKILHTYLENSESTSDRLDELACSILPRVPSQKTVAQDDCHGFPSLCPTTFVTWYRTLHEENLSVLNKLVKEVVLLEKHRADFQPEVVERLLNKLKQSVSVVVSLVNMCRTHDKVGVHAMAVKYGGKFVDLFLKVFGFLHTHFQKHNELIIQLVKELQKATRVIQTLCSEAKGLKQTVITSKIPATKRSMERFLFSVKALLHHTSSGCTFWMGNLKHKDLMGQVVSSQVYVDNQTENIEDDTAEPLDEDHPVDDAIASDEDGETN